VLLSVASPFNSGLPRFSGGSASITSLSGPAQASHALRPAALLNRPRRPLSRGFSPVGYPTKPLVSYQDLPTTSWVDPSSTGESRRWGARRVEERRGVAGAVRFPSPLIERSMRISRTTLSDWFHRGHTTAGHMSVYHASIRLGVATQLARKVPGFIQWFAGSRQSAGRHPLRQAHQKPGSFPPPALPDLNGHMTLSDSRQHRRPAATPRPLPSCQAGLPQLPGSPFQHAVPNTPMDQNGCVYRLLPHPTRAFPVSQAGRRPSLHFRGLLRLHSRYGLLDCSTAHGGLCHEASVQPVTRLNRSSATRSYRQLPGWILPPLVNRAVGAH